MVYTIYSIYYILETILYHTILHYSTRVLVSLITGPRGKVGPISASQLKSAGALPQSQETASGRKADPVDDTWSSLVKYRSPLKGPLRLGTSRNMESLKGLLQGDKNT